MNYTKVLLIQRQEELEQQLLIAYTMRERAAVDAELTQVAAAFRDL